MSKHLESVEITFENLDYVLVPVEYFEDFALPVFVQRLNAWR